MHVHTIKPTTLRNAKCGRQNDTTRCEIHRIKLSTELLIVFLFLPSEKATSIANCTFDAIEKSVSLMKRDDDDEAECNDERRC